MSAKKITFATIKKDGVVATIGKTSIEQPKIKFTSGEVKWFDDSKLLKK